MIWPATTRRDESGSIEIGGVALPAIAADYGTPVYVYDEQELRSAARAFQDGLAAAAYPRGRVVYAAKAFMSTAIVQLFHEEGLGIDVVSGGELFLALRSGMPPEEVSFHGSNKSAAELSEAISAGVGTIVIDNLHEIELLETLGSAQSTPVRVMLRVNPGVDAHTHRKISTGLADSKFGLPVAAGQAADAVERIVAVPNLRLIGYHAHVGSQLFDPEATIAAIEELLAFGASMRSRHGIEIEHLSPGGGFGIAYVDADQPLDPAAWTRIVADAVKVGCARHGLSLPILTVEPGRSLVGRAGVALYTVGSIKNLPAIRTYVAVDGGMTDNIRPALYEARYSAALANRNAHGPTEPVTISGKFCESGDILIERIDLPRLEAGDLLAIPAAGAYCLSMASNYNLALSPAVVMVNEGRSRLIRRRETYDDLMMTDVPSADHLTWS